MPAGCTVRRDAIATATTGNGSQDQLPATSGSQRAPNAGGVVDGLKPTPEKLGEIIRRLIAEARPHENTVTPRR